MGQIKILRDFASPLEGFPRTLRIYTPDEYAAQPERRFPVLYMQDGQNIYAHPDSAPDVTWCTNNTLERLVRERALEPWIVVGIDSGMGRLEDYSPWNEPRAKVKGRGATYTRFMVETLKPWVDATYRTLPSARTTAVMGSSLGGLISLYAGWKHPEVFGRVGGVSPSVMWSGGGLASHWKTRTAEWTRIYLDAGATEFLDAGGVPLRYGEATRAFHRHLQRLGYSDEELFLVLEPGGQHNEKDWQRRLPLALRWLLGGG